MRIAILVSLLVACSHDEHYLDVSWNTAHYGVVATGGSCPEGWTTARLVAIDAANPTEHHIDTFPCGDGAGHSSYLPADSYQAWLELANDDGSKVFATSEPETVWVTSFDPILMVNIYVDAGTAQVDYTGCPPDEAGVLDVRLDLTQPNYNPFVSTYEACTGTIQSPAVPPGMYTATFTYRDTVQIFADVAISAENHVTRIEASL